MSSWRFNVTQFVIIYTLNGQNDKILLYLLSQLNNNSNYKVLYHH